MEPIKITDAYLNKYYERININKFRLADMREDILKFSKFMIGFTPRPYQAYLFDKIIKHQKVAVVKGRQIGFSTSLALFCLWSAWFNKFPAGAKKNTEITVISKDDQSAKDLLQLIKDFMYMGDKHMSNFLKGKPEHSTQIFSKEMVKNNVDELKLNNGCVIRSYPPTGKIRHTANSLIILDEFAFINSTDPEAFYYTDVLPTISETGGKIVVSSTPNGFGGIFYEIIDPEEKKAKHEFYRMMVPFTINTSKKYQENVAMLKEHMDESKYAQEYLCDFTQNDVSFFQSRKIKEMFDENVNDLILDKYEYVCGIDYGMTEARTVITLCTKIDEIIYRVYYKEFESGWDINGVIPFMTGLKDRFNISKIIVDDCPQGDAVNKKMMEMGWNIELFDFHTKKIETYCAFRQKLNKGEIKMAYDAETECQFLEMQQEESKTGKLMIHKRRSGRDDICDSMILSSSHYLRTNENIGCYFV